MGRSASKIGQVIDLHAFFTARFFIKVSNPWIGAVWHGAKGRLPTKLSTDFVGEWRSRRRRGMRGAGCRAARPGRTGWAIIAGRISSARRENCCRSYKPQAGPSGP